MARLPTLLTISAFMGFAACSSQEAYRADPIDPPTVQHVNLEQYAGLWYEIARYPNGFQKQCEGVTAEYALRDDGKVDVTNTCHLGNERSATAIARIVPESGNAKLEVKFAPKWVPFAWGDYWILHLEDDYSAALVGSPDGKYLWILARAPVIPDALMDKIKQRAETLGYAIAPLKMTTHIGANTQGPAALTQQ